MMFYHDRADDPQYFDVVICGGGLAGLTLARQLRMNYPRLTIALLEKSRRPLPVACLKVGESSVEVGTHYFTTVLDLREYFEDKHVPKLGLRFFFGDAKGPFENRPELGAVEFPEVPSFQIDRGIFENDLRQMVADADVKLYEGWQVNDVVISGDEEPHRVLVRRDKESAPEELRCRWVVDATGRRRMLQTKFGLDKPNGHGASAAWFRMEGRIDVDDLVAPSRKEWHARVPDRTRYYSTNHLMGPGYWVWLIPLGSGNTSVGIVTSEKLHPIRNFNNYEMAFQWLRKHEPRLAKYLGDQQPLDFLCYKNFSYSSHQVLSHERWACVGEAGVFVDPFYSPGSDFICMGNTMVNDMIGMDIAGTLERDYVEDVNALFMSVNDSYVDLYRDSYDIFGVTHVMSAKILWDWAIYWAFFSQICFQNLLTRPELQKKLFELGRCYLPIKERVQQLFRDWGSQATSRDTYEFLNPFDVPYVHQMHVDLDRDKTTEEAIADIEANQVVFEEWANLLEQQAHSELNGTSAPVIAPVLSHTESGDTTADHEQSDDLRVRTRSRMAAEMQPVLG